MTSFKQVLEKVAGKRIERTTMNASTSGRTSREEMLGMAELTRLTFREPVELVPPGPKLNILMAGDIDPATGRAYPDYLERRRRRAEEEEGAGRGCCFAVIDHDVTPD